MSETDSDTVNTSAYASVDAAGSLHVVVLNKNFTQPADLTLKFAGPAAFGSAKVYAFDGSGPAITARATATVSSNQTSYVLPPLTAAHFVFQSTAGLPQFTAGPASLAIASGTTVVFGASSNAAAFQWLFNGTPLSDGGAIAGSAGPKLVITGATSANAGTYACVATNATGSVTSSAATLSVSGTSDVGRLVNISCRAVAGTGANQLIAGFVVGGQGTTGSEHLLIRGSGPALVPFGVTGTLPDPELQLYSIESGSSLLATNAGWGGDSTIASTAASVGAFAWTSASSHDAALIENLQNGPYTAQHRRAEQRQWCGARRGLRRDSRRQLHPEFPTAHKHLSAHASRGRRQHSHSGICDWRLDVKDRSRSPRRGPRLFSLGYPARFQTPS